MAGDNITLVSTNEQLKTVLGQHSFVALKFFANWCAPCRQFAPMYADMAKKYGDTVFFAEVDASGQSNEVAAAYSIASLPSILCFADGVIVKRIQGANIQLLNDFVGYAYHGWSPLAVALAVGDSQADAASLIQKGADGRWTHPGGLEPRLKGATILDAALVSRSRDRVRLALTAGADPRRPGLGGETPLTRARNAGCSKCAQEIESALSSKAPAASEPRACAGGACSLPARSKDAPAGTCTCDCSKRIQALEERVAQLEAQLLKLTA